ncbi:MAG: ATP-binding protein [Planctomycetaceae bacterium]|jgi:hypothetical protein|nr:ATP-binding protein [Planctomycetaceae bacterium]
MKTSKTPRLPYGNADFLRLRTGNFIYVDKTRFIELLEEEDNQSQIFIRPRRFGKSLFLSTLKYYYDVNYKNDFEQLFGDLYIGQNPTTLRNNYVVMEFNFSGIDTSNAETFRNSFAESIRRTAWRFIENHNNIFANTKSVVAQMKTHLYSALESIDLALGFAVSAKVKIFVIIDEYDHFANDIIAMGSVFGEDFYKSMITANGLVRDFYEKLKSETDSGTIYKTFITGISPVMLDDLTSGFNIATNYSLESRYNEMLGFTRKEVDEVMNAVGIETNQIDIDMEYYYNGYKFNGEAENTIYNSTMVLYFFGQILKNGKLLKDLIDPNLSIDPKRLKRLVRNESNRDILIQIIKDGGIVSKIVERFSINKLDSDSHLISQLFYIGLLTIKEAHLNGLRLTIPNYSIERIYWEQLRQLVEDNSQLVKMNTELVENSINDLAFEGNVHNFVDYVSQNAFSKLSAYDLQRFDEKYIKVLLLAYLLLNDIYIPMSEFEAVPGFVDIFLQRNPKYPQVKYEWALELKYCKTSAAPSEIEQKRKTGLEQLNKYVNSPRLKNRTNLKSALIIFIGKDKYEIIETGSAASGNVNQL